MLCWLLAILFLCGVIGGVVGYLDEMTAGQNKGWPLFWRYLLLGVAASFIVPLFLNTISSTLVTDALTSKFPEASVKLLVIAGFCLVASISSRRFIDRISEKLLQEVSEARQIAENADEKIDLLVEPDERSSWPRVSSSVTTDYRYPQSPQQELDSHERKVLRAMDNSTFSTRAFSGIVNDTNLNEEDLQSSLEKLVSKGLLEKKATKKGYERWSLTGEGKSEARKIGDGGDL